MAFRFQIPDSTLASRDATKLQQPAALPIYDWDAHGGPQIAPQVQPQTQVQSAPQAAPQDPKAFIQQWQATHPASRESYEQMFQAMQQAGYPVERPTHAGGTQLSNDKISVGGEVYDLLSNEGGADSGWTMAQDGYWVNGKPASDPYGAPPMPEGFSAQGNGSLASFSAPGLAAPYTQEFKGPSAEDVMNSPAVQARMQMGTEALQRSSAAKGTLLTGGALKDLNAFAQGVASQEYGNEWNRQFQGAGFNRDTFWGNQNNAYSKLAGFTQLGQQGAGQLGAYGSQYGDNSTKLAGAGAGLAADAGQNNANATIAGAASSGAAGAGVANAAGELNWGTGGYRGTDWKNLFRKPT